MNLPTSLSLEELQLRKFPDLVQRMSHKQAHDDMMTNKLEDLITTRGIR